MPAAERPIADAEIEAWFAPIATVRSVVLAVSGGADSLALMLLAERWRRQHGVGPQLHVVTVDHGLRPQGRAESEMVLRLASGLGLAAIRRTWDGPKPRTGVEAAARQARYRLLVETARDLGASHVLTGHHRDDQAETVLIRLGGGSGLKGLGAMRSLRELAADVQLFRPLLSVPKARLRTVVTAAGWEPAEDASNGDTGFARGRLRRAMPILAQEGVSTAGLVRTAERLARADAALDVYAARLLAEAVVVDGLAVAHVDRRRLRGEPVEVRLRALARVIDAVGAGGWSPRGDRLEALEVAVSGDGDFRRTLGGAVVAARGEALLAWRELGRAVLPDIHIGSGFEEVWDRRFRVRVERSGLAEGLAIGPLGETGRREIGILGDGRPIGALAALPAIRHRERIVAVPAVGFADLPSDRLSVAAECIVGERILVGQA